MTQLVPQENPLQSTPQSDQASASSQVAISTSIQNDTSIQTQEFVKTEEFRKIIEVEVLKIIKDLADKGETTRERIQEIASHTLGLIRPGMTLEQLFNSAVKLDDKFPELAPVVVKVMRIYEDQYEQRALDQVRMLVKGGNYDEANNMVKKVLLFRVS
ncbi:MAG: hypothetical protein ABIO02_01190 [Patescibacteria group bacterium]